jgi:NitT/TauT family transport system permease protein
VSRALFAPPSAILQSIYRLTFETNTLLDAFLISMGSLLIGYTLAAVVGIAVGVLMGRHATLERVLDPWVSFLYALPTVALLPILVVWVGIDIALRVFLIFLSGVFIMIISTMVGVKNIDQEVLDIGRTNGATERQLIRTIVLPGALPYIFGGLRVALAQSLIGVIVAEMLTTVTGLGALIITASNFFRTADMFVPILTVMVTSVVLTVLLDRLQRRLTPWHRPAEL